jgi:uncharacterized protein with HEPN domain
MRRERSLLQDIIESCDEIAEFIKGLSEAQFADNRLVRSAVLQKLTVIGEATARLSAEFRERHPEIEWRDIVGIRNILVHAYFRVDWPIVWIAVTEETPRLRQQVAAVVAAEFPDPEAPGPSI